MENEANISYCPNCGKKIIQNKGKKPKRFCSNKCKCRWWHSHQEETNCKVTVMCSVCGKEFTVYGKKTDRKYCSRACYNKARDAAWEKWHKEKCEKLERERVSCGALLQDLPAGCRCPFCEWFIDKKRSCPCKKKTLEEVQSDNIKNV